MYPPVNVLCPADETQEEFFSNHNIALLGSHRQTLMIKLTHSDCAAAPDPDLHRRHQIHLKCTGWNASLNLPWVPKWQRNGRILLGVQICILHQHRFHSLKDLQMCWSHYRPALLCCIICGSFLAISPAWKISSKHQGFPLGFILFIGDFGMLMLQLYHILLRPRAYSMLTDQFQEGDGVFLSFFLFR